ncbi:hypothetical protein KEM55_000483, partial [Ascosphaera atra]
KKMAPARAPAPTIPTTTPAAIAPLLEPEDFEFELDASVDEEDASVDEEDAVAVLFVTTTVSLLLVAVAEREEVEVLEDLDELSLLADLGFLLPVV